MTEFILKGKYETDEEKQKVNEMAKNEGFELVIVKDDEEVMITPKSLYMQKNMLDKKIVKECEKDFVKAAEDFFDEHAIEFQKNKVGIPYYLQFELDSEYDDNGGSYLYMSSIHLFDKDKKRIKCDFEVKTSWGECEIEELMLEELRESVDSDYIEEMFEGETYIEIPRGV